VEESEKLGEKNKSRKPPTWKANKYKKERGEMQAISKIRIALPGRRSGGWNEEKGTSNRNGPYFVLIFLDRLHSLSKTPNNGGAKRRGL